MARIKSEGVFSSMSNSSSDVAISAKQVSKSFELPHNKQNSIKGGLINIISRGDRSFEKQKVLQDISFEIKKGEFFGIVGRNGSGKSTLLKMLGGIYTPSGGSITINGSLTPFIELGVGFNPELTGRENVFLNGALLGFNRDEVAKMYDDIVKFAELEKFMDQHLKNYSSGMQVRLAFSIAIRAQSDILLLDEVLAVGDEAFQRKCYSYFETLRRNKKTVVLVTHDMSAVERFCTRAMFIEEGAIVKIGRPHEVAAAYSHSNDDVYSESKKEEKKPKPKKSGIKIRLSNDNNKEANQFNSGEGLTVEMAWEKTGVENVGVSIVRENGDFIFGQNTFFDRSGAALVKNQSAVFRTVLNLSEGNYFIIAALFGKNETDRLAYEEKGPTFVVNRDKSDTRWGGITKLEYEWREAHV